MKTKILCVCGWLGLTAIASGQSATGSINFFNSTGTKVSLSSWNGDLGYMPATPGLFRFQLFIAPEGTVSPWTFTPTQVFGTNQASEGRFSGGALRLVEGVQAGDRRAILVRGWSASLGQTYTEAKVNFDSGLAGFLGESSIAPSFVFGGFDGVGTIPTSPAFGGAYGIQNGFTLFGIPEPTTLSLMATMFPTLFIWRRKNQAIQV